jgi:hypothetical protein
VETKKQWRVKEGLLPVLALVAETCRKYTKIDESSSVEIGPNVPVDLQG